MSDGRRSRGTRLGAVAVVVAALAVGCARRTDPSVVLPGRGAPTPGDVSRAGRDRGDVEIALGAVTIAVATTLVVLGSVSVARALALRSTCAAETAIEPPECEDPLGLSPVTGGLVSGGLALAFAVPIAAGGGVLLRKGVRMRREFMRRQGPKNLSLRPWLDGRGAGLGLGFQF